MSRYQPATASSNAIIRPPCPQCGTQMMLARIEPLEDGFDKRTFECPNCDHALDTVVKFVRDTPTSPT